MPLQPGQAADEMRIVTESTIINEYINDAFDGPELLPDDPYDRVCVALWCKQIDDSLHLNVFTLFFVSSLDSVMRRRSPEELEINLPFEVNKTRPMASPLFRARINSMLSGIAREFPAGSDSHRHYHTKVC